MSPASVKQEKISKIQHECKSDGTRRSANAVFLGRGEVRYVGGGNRNCKVARGDYAAHVRIPAERSV